MAKRETERILDGLGVVVRQLTRISGSLQDSAALTATQQLALRELTVDGPLRVGDLAQRMGITPPTASRAVDALVDHGLVERLTDPDDRRALRIDVTPEGRERFAARHARVSAAFEPAAAALSAQERAELARLLDRLAAGLESHAG